MATLSITLPENIAQIAQQRCSESGLSSVEQYVTDLIKADITLPISPQLEAELLKGRGGEAIDFRDIDWKAKKQALIDRHRAAVSA